MPHGSRRVVAEQLSELRQLLTDLTAVFLKSVHMRSLTLIIPLRMTDSDQQAFACCASAAFQLALPRETEA